MSEKQREQARSNLLARDVLPADFVFDAKAMAQIDRLVRNDRRAGAMAAIGLGVCQMLAILLCVVVGWFTPIPAGETPFGLSTLFLVFVLFGIQLGQLFPMLSLRRSNRSPVTPQATTKLDVYRSWWLPLLYLVPVGASIAVSALLSMHRVPAAYYLNSGSDSPTAIYPPLWLLILLPSLQLLLIGVTEGLAQLAARRTLGGDGLDAALVASADTYWRRRAITINLYGSIGLLIGIFWLASSSFDLLSQHTLFVTVLRVTPFVFFIGLAIYNFRRGLSVGRSVVKLVPWAELQRQQASQQGQQQIQPQA